MKAAPRNEGRCRTGVRWAARWSRAAVFGSLALLGFAPGCAGLPEPGGREPGAARARLEIDNGLTTNGLITNGLVTNGMSTNGLAPGTGSNGLAVNGLSSNGLSSADFATWFNANPASYSDMVMEYVVRCAVASGNSRTWTNPSTAVTYTWSGELGLTPGWASGLAATQVEQQVITACLAAHVNKYGVHVDVSVLGLDATGTPIPIGANELGTFTVREACFFGNLFTGAGAYVGNDSSPLGPSQSSVRACALMPQVSGTSTECAPMVYVGSCSAANCQLDSTGTYYLTCSSNGTSYPALTTRIETQDIYACGDGVCQVSESCGTGTTYDSCNSDCGACP